MNSNLRLAFRQLAKARGFTVIATLTLAIGIGSTTAMFSALRALVLHPFDYPDSHELAHVWSGDYWPLSPGDFHDLHAQNTSFEHFGIYQPANVNVGRENAQAVRGVFSTAGVLHAFGVNPLFGRWLSEEDGNTGATPVVIIGHRLWQQTYGGDPGILGSTIRINGTDAEVVGVMPPTFEFASPWMRTADCQIWLPYKFGEKERTERGSHYLCGIARLRDGVSLEAADAEIKSIGRQLATLHPNSNARKKFLVRSLHFEMTRDIGKRVWLLFAAVAAVLLVACANVASMLLARSAQRQGEFAVRVALGATRRRLVGLALTESLVLAGIGAAVGTVLAFGGVEVLRNIAPVTEARKAAIAIDGLTLSFALGAAFLTALIAGLPPALAAARTSLAGVIRLDARGSAGSRSRNVMLRTLVVAQIAVAFLLANGAALFSASYFKILEQNRTFATEHVLTAGIYLSSTAYNENEARVRFWNTLAERLQALPGVASVGLTSKLSLDGASSTQALVNDQVFDPAAQRLNVERSSVTSGFFETLGIPLLRGRLLTSADDMSKDGHLGVVVNRAFVEKAWPDKDPIGQVFRANQPKDPWYTATVVGVVENVRQSGAASEPRPEMYTTPPGHWGRFVYINVRSSQPAANLTPLVRQTLAELDRELALQGVRTMKQVMRDSMANERAVTGLVDFFMAIALALVAVGLYGTLSFSIVQRTREIGVRLAIGAVGRDILRLIMAQGLRWVLVGLLIGLAGTFALAGTLKGIVHGMQGLSVTPVLLAAVVVALAATLAILIPALRAARLDPVRALHSD